jgi:hypothetical protein
MRILVLSATYELRLSRKSHLRDHPNQKIVCLLRFTNKKSYYQNYSYLRSYSTAKAFYIYTYLFNPLIASLSVLPFPDQRSDYLLHTSAPGRACMFHIHLCFPWMPALRTSYCVSWRVYSTLYRILCCPWPDVSVISHCVLPLDVSVQQPVLSREVKVSDLQAACDEPGRICLWEPVLCWTWIYDCPLTVIISLRSARW